MSERPSPEAAAQALAEVLARKFPNLDVHAGGRGKRLPPGARRLRGALPVDPETLRDVDVRRARKRRRDLDAVDQ